MLTSHRHVTRSLSSDVTGDRLAVFPGIELRSELGGRESVHYIGIFAPEADLQHVWTTLQGKLSITPRDVAEKGGDDAISVDFQEGRNVIHDLGGVADIMQFSIPVQSAKCWNFTFGHDGKHHCNIIGLHENNRVGELGQKHVKRKTTSEVISAFVR